MEKYAPFTAGRTDAQIDIDTQQDWYVNARGKAGLHTAGTEKDETMTIFEYITKRYENIEKSAVFTDVIAAYATYIE